MFDWMEFLSIHAGCAMGKCLVFGLLNDYQCVVLVVHV